MIVVLQCQKQRTSNLQRKTDSFGPKRLTSRRRTSICCKNNIRHLDVSALRWTSSFFRFFFGLRRGRGRRPEDSIVCKSFDSKHECCLICQLFLLAGSAGCHRRCVGSASPPSDGLVLEGARSAPEDHIACKSFDSQHKASALCSALCSTGTGNCHRRCF